MRSSNFHYVERIENIQTVIDKSPPWGEVTDRTLTPALAHRHMVGHATAALGAAEARLDQRHVVPPLIDQLLQVRLRRVMAGSAPDVQPQELRREHAIPLSIDTNRGGWA